jgi:uncharacterized protein (TIGR00251 family)
MSIVPENSQTDILIRVLPRASRNQIVGIDSGVLKVKLTAPPLEGKANKALRQFLARKLGVPKKDVEIVSGEKSRMKSIRIYGLLPEDVNVRLEV